MRAMQEVGSRRTMNGDDASKPAVEATGETPAKLRMRIPRRLERGGHA
jgi:hypothetical protein